METFSALLAICAGNSPVTGEFPAQRPVTQSFDVLFDLCLNKRLSKQSWSWWFEMLSRPLWRHCHGIPQYWILTSNLFQEFSLKDVYSVHIFQGGTKFCYVAMCIIKETIFVIHDICPGFPWNYTLCFNEVERGYTGFTLSIRLSIFHSVHLSICGRNHVHSIFHNTCHIHLIFCTSYQPTSDDVPHVEFL